MVEAVETPSRLLKWPRTPNRGAFYFLNISAMKQDTNPSRQHRPNRWARLKKQLKQARAEADTAKRQRDWAHLFIASTNQWQEFSRWAQEQANNDADPSESAFTYFVNALNAAQAEADRATHRLTIAQKISKMYEEQKEGYYNMMGTQGAQIDKLMSIVESLTERVIQQREEIQALKKQRQYNDTPEADTPNASTD